MDEDHGTSDLHTNGDIDKLISENNNDACILIRDRFRIVGTYCDYGTTLLHRLAIYPDKAHLIKYLVEKYNANINSFTSKWYTPLELAAMSNVENVKILLALGANPNLENPLSVAFSRIKVAKTMDDVDKIVEICSLLLNHGAKPILSCGLPFEQFQKTRCWTRFTTFGSDTKFVDDTLEKFKNISEVINIKPAKAKL